MLTSLYRPGLSHSSTLAVDAEYIPRATRRLYSEAMATVTEIGNLISQDPSLRGGRPCVAGTGVSVRRIAQWHNMGLIPEEILRKIDHLTLAQVHAALAYYHANQSEMDAEMESEARTAQALEQQHRC